MKVRHAAALALVMALTATIGSVSCATATRKEFVATGGSRADGVVVLSYEYGMYEEPQEDQEQGAALAASICAGWGYVGANPFGETQQCQPVNGYGNCFPKKVTRRYQCTGVPSTSNVPVPATGVPAPALKQNTTPVSSGQI